MTITFREHRREDLITKVGGAPYIEGATCPQWLAFLDRVMAGNQAMIDFLQRAVGYSLCGETTEQCLFLLYGTGANGKSTFLDTLLAMFGDYGTTASFDTFLQRDRTGQATNDIARLQGVRFVVASEPDAGKRFSESVLKQLTGGDMVTARFLNKEFFSFRPQFHLWLAANHKPAISGTDEGIWRRIRLVPFTVHIPAHEQDRSLGIKLLSGLPGIFQWALEGHRRWQAEGLGVPLEVTTATASYRAEMDVIGAFLGEECVEHASAYVSSAELYTAYSKWATENGERVMTQRMLAGRLMERGYGSELRGAERKRCWVGIGLRDFERSQGVIADRIGSHPPIRDVYAPAIGHNLQNDDRMRSAITPAETASCPQCGGALQSGRCAACEVSVCRGCGVTVSGLLRSYCDRCAAKGG